MSTVLAAGFSGVIGLTDWYLGTVGFSYKDWDGVFYPQGAPARSYLAHYSQIFNAVELDSTFYGTPPAERVRQWAVTVPPSFKFCPKTPRQITHDMRLINTGDLMQAYLETMQLLNEHLGPILIQLPPSFAAAEFDTVDKFLNREGECEHGVCNTFAYFVILGKDQNDRDFVVLLSNRTADTYSCTSKGSSVDDNQTCIG